MTEDDPRHGTPNGYSNLGCRCDRCRRANTEYHWLHGTAGYAMDNCPDCGGPKRSVANRCRACYLHLNRRVCGTTAGYNKGCRCDLCRKAKAVYDARRRGALVEAGS